MKSVFALALVSSLALAGSALAEDCPEGQRLFAHAFLEGGQKCIPAKPERIAFTMEQIISAYTLGGESVVDNWYFQAFRESYPNALPNEQAAALVNLDYYPESSPESMILAEPDLIVSSAGIPLNAQVEGVAPLVAFNWTDDATWRDQHDFIAALLQVEDKGAELLNGLEARIAKLDEDLGTEPRTFVIVRTMDEAASLQVFTEANFGAQLLTKAGMVMGPKILSAAESAELARPWWYQLSGEHVADLEVNHLFLLKGWDADLEADWLRNPLWNNLAVVKDGRVVNAVANGEHYIRENVAFAHLILDDVYRQVLGADPQEVNPNPFADWLATE